MLDKATKEEKSHQFLMGLNDDVYLAIRSQILGLEPMPSLDKIFNMVSEEENHKTYMISEDDRSEAVAFAVKPATWTPERAPCKHYGQTGHAESLCYEIIGYPPNGPRRGCGARGYCGGRAAGGRGRGGGRDANRESAYAMVVQAESS